MLAVDPNADPQTGIAWLEALDANASALGQARHTAWQPMALFHAGQLFKFYHVSTKRVAWGLADVTSGEPIGKLANLCHLRRLRLRLPAIRLFP